MCKKIVMLILFSLFLSNSYAEYSKSVQIGKQLLTDSVYFDTLSDAEQAAICTGTLIYYQQCISSDEV